MKTLYDPSAVYELQDRLMNLRPYSEPRWGKMTAAQAMAHCAAWVEMASGLTTPPRNLVGRIFGRIAKSSVLGEKPIRPNMPTDKSLIMNEERDFAAEKQRLREAVASFAAAGPSGCTKHPHSFFGPMTPEEWAVMGYKHLDHHLRQFGA